ncbi:MAG: hypothetical protein JNL82_29630 [Myxococcales bacterium]|nr:hypothetical protein [Myxococcales bacterium]
MRPSIASTLALVLTVHPCVAHAGKFSAKQLDTLKTITAGSNDPARLDAAVVLARAELDRKELDTAYRKAVVREGKTVAVMLFERDRSDPERAAAAVSALCWAVDVTRIYEAELASPEELDKFSSERARLEGMATEVDAPCAPVPKAPPVAPASPDTSSVPSQAAPEIRHEGPESPPTPRAAPRSRAQIAVGAALMTVGAGLAAGLAGCFVASGQARTRIAEIGDLADEAGRGLTTDEWTEAAAADTRALRLTRAGTALGVFAAVSVIVGIVVLARPPRPTSHVHARLVGAGVRFQF